MKHKEQLSSFFLYQNVLIFHSLSLLTANELVINLTVVKEIITKTHKKAKQNYVRSNFSYTHIISSFEN